MHTAILAREIRRTIPGSDIPNLSAWMMRDPRERRAEANGQILSVLGTVGIKMTPAEANKKLRAERRARKKLKAKKRSRR